MINLSLDQNDLVIQTDEKKIDIVSPICPDYSVEYIAPGLYRFTFKKLNSGIGVIGKKILKNLDKIHNFFKKHKIKRGESCVFF